MSSDWVGSGISTPAAVSSGGSLSCCGAIDSGEGPLAGVFRFTGAGLVIFEAEVKPSDLGSGRSSSESIFSASSSSSSVTVVDLLRLAVAGFFAVGFDLTELSDSVVGMRGNLDGLSGLNAGPLLFDGG